MVENRERRDRLVDGFVAAPEPPIERAERTSEGDEVNNRLARMSLLLLRLELGGLVIQFLLGMYINLYVPTPRAQPVLVAHIALGSVLLVCGILAVFAAVVARAHALYPPLVFGAGSLALAFTGGIRFRFGGQHNIDSYLMALGFVAAMSMFGWALLQRERGS